jgi:hypothetical protein
VTLYEKCRYSRSLCEHYYSEQLRASTFGLVLGVVTGLRVQVGVNALQEFVAVNGLKVTDGSSRLPNCSLAEGMTKVCATKSLNLVELRFTTSSP